MKIENMNIHQIKPYANNPRINDEAVAYVANSIKRFGFRSPIVVDKNNVIIAGHTRFKAAQRLGLTQVPVICAKDLSDDQVKAYRLADNKSAEVSKWDFEKLDIELDDIDMDMSQFGFDEMHFDLDLKDSGGDIDQEDEDDGYYGDARENTYNQYNLNDYDPNRTDGRFNIPTLAPIDYMPDELLGFNYATGSDEYEKGVHFFIDDYQFERLWRQPKKYFEILSRFDCMLTPDYSLYLDMPMAMKIWNVYRARMLGQMAQDRGIKVIPTLMYAEPDTYQFCFDGLPRHSTYATSTVGVIRDEEAKTIWIEGMNAAIERLEPKNLLIYGSPIEFDYGSINVKHIEARKFENAKG